MPTLPLYTPSAVPDASHRVAAPGGYETWHFDAESAAGDVTLVAELGVGAPLYEPYLRRYFRYRRRPTRWPPPVPGEYPFARFAVYENGRALARFTTIAPPEDFADSPREPAVRVAGNEVVREGDGSMSLRLRGLPAGPEARGRGACLSAQLVFRPLMSHPPFETALLGGAVTSDVHRWVVAGPLCEVSGSVLFTPAGGEDSRGGAREIDFRGRGYHDHRYGTGPLAATFRCWASGRILLGDTTYAFHTARPLARGTTDEALLVRFAPDGVRAVEPGSLRVAWDSRSPLELPYPAEITCDGRLRLTAPRVIDADRSSVRLRYHASVHGGREEGTAWCEVGYPARNTSMLRRWLTKVV